MTTLNKEVSTILQTTGFSENEASIYLNLLEFGQSSIWDISKRTKIKRPTCYIILNELLIKGFANSYYDGKRMIFSVVTPKQLNHSINFRFKKFQKILPQLEGIASKSVNKPGVQLYEGREGIIEVYNLSLDQQNSSEILIYGTSQVETGYKDFIDEYIKNRVAKKITARVILADTPDNRKTSQRDKRALRKTRFLDPNKFQQSTEINIFQDMIAYIAHSEKEPFATVIESSTLAEEERSRFNLLWDIAKN